MAEAGDVLRKEIFVYFHSLASLKISTCREQPRVIVSVVQDTDAMEDRLKESPFEIIGEAADLEMLPEPSLGIAFNANQFLLDGPRGTLSLPNLDTVLYFLSILFQKWKHLNCISTFINN